MSDAYGGHMRYIRNEKGSQLLEFTGILPLFLLMIIIVVQVAMAASAAVTAKAAAMDGARVAMTRDSSDEDYKTAVRNVASGYTVTSITRSDSSDGLFQYVTVRVTMEVPLLNNKRLFDTTGMSIPVSAEVTLKKEE